MFKRKIKIMAAMLSLVILVACIGDTFSKYTATNSTTVDMDIEMPYNSNLHGDSLLSPDEMYNGIKYTVETTDDNGATVTQEITCRVLIDTNKVSISLSDNKKYLRVTTHAQIAGNEAGYCFDPFVILNFQTDFEIHGMSGYKFSHKDDKTEETTDYYGLPTSSVRYAVIPYYVPYVDPTTLPKYSYTTADGTTYTKTYSIHNYDHLRVYTSTTINRGASGGNFGNSRYAVCPHVGCNGNGVPKAPQGAWVCALVDLEQTNLSGTQGGSNGTPNWDGNIYELRLDIGQIGGFDAWHENYDCPDGMTMYIGDIRFFSSLYAAERAVQNLYHSGEYSNNPATGLANTNPAMRTYNDDIMAYKKDGVYTTISYAKHVEEEKAKLNGGT